MYIEMKGITVVFKKQQVLTSLDLSIKKGECVGIIGHNGSGKSVLLKVLCGFLVPSQGQILVNEREVVPGKEFIRNAGIIIEQGEMIGYLSGLQNLTYLADIYRKISKDELVTSLKIVDLYQDKDKKVKHYSLGMKQRLRIAQAIMEDPEILILDEPLNGLDKAGVKKILELLKELKSQGKTIILTSHDERQINYLCERVYQLEGGVFI